MEVNCDVLTARLCFPRSDLICFKEATTRTIDVCAHHDGFWCVWHSARQPLEARRLSHSSHIGSIHEELI